MKQKLYIITRSDILNHGQITAQTLHAGIEYIYQYKKKKKTKLWKKDSNTVVCFTFINEEQNQEIQFLYLIEKLNEKNIRYTIFKEPDLNDAITSIAFITTSNKIDEINFFPIFLKLIGRPNNENL